MSSSMARNNSGSEEDPRAAMDQRKRKRMISNRESARRSRMRKQKHLDDLISQADELRKENQRIETDTNVKTQDYLRVASENSILRAQADELTHRLQSLNEIIEVLSVGNNGAGGAYAGHGPVIDGFLMDPVSLGYFNQPILASADMFEY